MKIKLEKLRQSENETMPWEREYSDEQRAEMKVRKDAGELLPGHKKRRGPNERSIHNLTEKDYRVMLHLGKHKGGSSRIMGVHMGVNTRTVHNRLDGLKKLKLVNYHNVGGDTRYFWYLTPAGKKKVIEQGLALHHELSTGRPQFKTEVDTHALAVSMTAAHIIAGTYDVGEVIDDLVIGETAIKSQWQTVLGGFKNADSLGKGAAGQKLKIDVLNKVKAGEIRWDQIMEENPALWTLTGRLVDPKIENFHLPDLVLNLEEGRGQTPQSIAYEIELTQKTVKRYEQTLALYKEDRIAFAKVVWVVNSKNIAASIAQAARNIGFPTDRLKFDWLRGEDKKPFTDFAYKL